MPIKVFEKTRSLAREGGKPMKRILSLLLSIVMILSMVPAGAFASTLEETVPEILETVPEETAAAAETTVIETTAATEEAPAETAEATEAPAAETTVPTEEAVEETTSATEETVAETTPATEEIVEETLAEEAAAGEILLESVELPLPEDFPEEYKELDEAHIWGTDSITLTALVEPAEAAADLYWNWFLAEGDEAYAAFVHKGGSVTVTGADVSELRTVTITGVYYGLDGSTGEVSREIHIHPRARKIDIVVNDEIVTDQIVTFDLKVLVGEEPNLYYQTLQPISAIIAPADDLNSVTWSSSDRSIARIKTDRITGDVSVQFVGKAGYVDILATANDGSGTVGKVTFNAIGLAQNITVTEESAFHLVSGQSGTLHLEETLYEGQPPVAVPGSCVVWRLADERDAAYLTVTSAGKVTAKTIHAPVTVPLLATVTFSDETRPMQVVQVEHSIDLYPAVTKVEILFGEQVANDKIILWDVADGDFTLSAIQFPEVVYGIPEWTVTDSKKAFVATVDKETNQLTLDVNDDPNDLHLPDISKRFSTVTVKATATDGSGKAATVKVKLDRFVNDVDIVSNLGASPVLFGGDTMQLTSVATAKDITKTPTNTAVTWKLLDPADSAYVTLSSGGKITVKKTIVDGKNITVMATAKDGYGAMDIFTFTVLPADLGVPVIVHDDRNVTNTTLLVNILDNDTITLGAQVYSGPSPHQMHWKSTSKSAVVYDNYDNTADIQLLKAGTYTVTAYDDFGNKAKVTIKAAKLSSGVEISSKTEEFCVSSGKSLQLVGTVLPEGEVANKAVTWWIDPADAAYAKISATGKLTATAGLAVTRDITVWAQAKDGYSDPVSETITIQPLSTGLHILLDGENVTNTTFVWDLTTGGDYLSLEAVAFPSTASQYVTWTSSSKGVAAIDKATGEITIGRAGTATITATAADGSGKKATFKLQVIRTMESLELSKVVAAVAGGKSLTFKATPDKLATNKALRWSLTGESEFATISQTGVLKTSKVTAVKEVTVVVTALDGSGLVAECPVTIYPSPISKIQIFYQGTAAPKTVGMYKEDSITLEAFSFPGDAASGAGAYTWKSSSKCVEIEDNLDGTITVYGVRAGTATITCSAADGSGKKATVKVKVVNP